MAYNTGNASGSTSPKDLIDNAEDFDQLLTGVAVSVPNRLGVPLKSWKGMEGEFLADQVSRANTFIATQNAKQAAFEAAQLARANEYTADKTYRDTTYVADKNSRDTVFSVDQGNRATQFSAFMDASGFEPPIAYASGILLDRTTKTVTYLGNEYRARSSFIPFTTSNWTTDAAKLKLIGDDSLRQDLASPIGATDVGTVQPGANPAPSTVQSDVNAIGGALASLDSDPVMIRQDLSYNRDSIGLGYSNGELHLNGNLHLGGVRNLMVNTEGGTAISAINATKDSTQSIKYRKISLERFYGSSFYSAFHSSMSGNSIVLEVGKKYLVSCYVLNVSDSEQFIWSKPLVNAGDYGHGAKLVDGNVRRIWTLVQATTTSVVDLMKDPTVALGSGTGGNVYWAVLNKDSSSFDLRMGGFQIELVPDDTKMGVAVIGDSTVAGSSGKKDLAASTEWTRWAESILNVPFLNRAVGGETTANMRARWVADMTPLAVNANYAIIQGGINDISQGRLLADIKTDILWMEAQARADGMQPIICTCTPTSTIQADPAKETMRKDLNKWIKQTFALKLDLDKVVRDQRNPALLRQKSGWVGDGTHFDPEAKRAIGVYVSSWPFWDFIKPTSYQARNGNISIEPVRSGTLSHMGSGYSILDVSVAGSTQTFKNDQRLDAPVLELAGVLTGLKTVFIQGFIPKLWFVRNTTSGAFVLSLRGLDAAFAPIGSTIPIGQGKGAWILSTGTGLVRASADV